MQHPCTAEVRGTSKGSAMQRHRWCGTDEAQLTDVVACGGNPPSSLPCAGTTPLTWAALNGYTAAVEALLAGGAEVNSSNNNGA